ncbi:MAG: PKD-like family lipoprotein [Prevotella sp.]
MKKKIYSLSLLTLLVASCVNDDSNEGLLALNEANISGIEDTYDNVYVDDRLVITPKVSSALGDEAAYSYFWIAYDKNTYYEADTLSHSKDLDIVVSLTPGEHTLKFKVVDNKTGIFYEKVATVNVMNEFTNGLLVLADKGGEAVLDFWNPSKDRVVEDVYGKMNGGDKIGENPVRVYFNKYTNDEASEVLVFCQDGKGGKIINSIMMTRMYQYGDFFMTMPDVVAPQAYFRSSMREYLVNDGLVYDRATNSYTPSQMVKPNLSVQGKTYRIAPNANLNDDGSFPYRAALYDNENGCFYTLFNISTAFLTTARKTNKMEWVDGGFFDPDNVGMECVYANVNARSVTDAREYLGVFRTPEGECHLLTFGIGFYTDETPANYFKDLGNDIITDETFRNASSYACSASFSRYMFYAKDNGLYIYNVLSQTSKKIYEFAPSVSINHIELENVGNQLWVAYRDDQQAALKGGFAVFTVATDGGVNVQLVTKHDALADRIVDFEQKY